MDIQIFDTHFLIYNVDCSSTNPISTKNRFLEIPVDKKVVVDGEKIICIQQIEIALIRATQAELNGTMLANDWSIEVLLHLRGKHQIRKSLDFFDISYNTKNIVLIIQEKRIVHRVFLCVFLPPKEENQQLSSYLDKHHH